jgi:hypothetical protein
MSPGTKQEVKEVVEEEPVTDLSLEMSPFVVTTYNDYKSTLTETL